MQAEFQPWRMLANRMPEVQKTLRFVEGDPMVNAISETVHDDFNVVGEPFRTVGIQPPTAQESS